MFCIIIAASPAGAGGNLLQRPGSTQSVESDDASVHLAGTECPEAMASAT
jgi:hypothetical protein